MEYLSTHISFSFGYSAFIDFRSRFPSLKVLVGHLGERVPSDIWRINDRMFPVYNEVKY
jgi:hypothetical protein